MLRATILIIVLGLTACRLVPPSQTHLPFLPGIGEATPEATPTVFNRYRELLPPTASTITSTLQVASPKTNTPTPVETNDLPTVVPTSTVTNTPHFSSDLLFLSERRLGRWNDVSNDLSLMAPNVTSFASSDNGYKVALLRSRGLVTQDGNLFNLDLMDLQTNHTRTILSDTQQVYRLALSPDGQWIAYTSLEKGGSIYLLATNTNASPIKLGNCTQSDHTLNCDNGPLWSLDNRSLAWSDEQGVWVHTLDSDQTKLAIPGKLEVSDPKGEISHIQVAFNQMAWSPQGRYLKAKISPAGSNVFWQAILDTLTGRVAEVPDTYAQAHVSSTLAWLPDGRLCQIRSSDHQQKQGPIAKLWRVLPTRDDLLLELKSFSLQSNDFPSVAYNFPELNDIPAWLEDIDDQLVSFALFLPEKSQPGILFTMDLQFGTLQKINELPSDTQMILWAPDHTGTLVRDQQGEILFVPRDGSTPRNLVQLLGNDAQEFHWLPMTSIH
jgi:hypothetical protein